jgi:fructoselysine-6-P-deglycase FrlB-like protein
MTNRTSHVAEEIRSQPTAWRRAMELAPSLGDVLPQPGERVAVVGCGTSWFMAESYAVLREQSGQGQTDAFAASELPAERRYDRLLAITRSGTTTEVLEALDGSQVRRTAITADPATPVADLADDCVALDFADEKSVVQTVFATSVLMLLRASLGDSVGDPHGDSLGAVVEQAERVLSRSREDFQHSEQYTFLGAGWAHGVAREAALKMREAAQLWTESYPQMEYRHGPISIAQPGRTVWVFGEPVPGLLDDVTATGARVVCDDLDPLADVVRVQLLAVREAESRGLDPDRPRHLTRSVVLDAS